ncbi:Tolloid-like protein 2 [Stylophora pistillata]|uniref:Tolloid-like protein 2 n=1 Tax=Stylophora pistillata TaxID=50429 RepID=A0A2B4RGD4_STYPI|nr:Tolloid-like protein 2 [Stylophora pistillata]
MRDIDGCAKHPCSNNGTCSDHVDGFKCICPAGFEGSRCEIVTVAVNGSCENSTVWPLLNGDVIIESNQIGSSYHNHMDCHWKLSSNTRIELVFIHFDLEAKHDYVEIYDGGSLSAPLIDRINGSSTPSPVTSSSKKLFLRFKTDHSVIRTGFRARFREGFQDLLAGSEYTQILTVVANQIGTLRIIDNLQKEYLEATKTYKQNPNQDLMQQRRQKWFDDDEDHFVALKEALILLLENICDPILNTYDVFEGYAWKNGEQGTSALTDLMNFIARIRLLEANGYAVSKSHIYKKYEDNEYRRTVELNSVDNKMKKVAQCEDPAIARAFTRMIDHQDDTSKCLFLIEPGNRDLSTGFKVLPCNSNYPNKKFNFEYLTQQMPSEPMLHTFFKLKVKNDGFTYDGWQGQNLCLAYRPIGGYTGPAFQDWSPRPFACVCPSPPNVPWCIGDFVPNFEYGWFKFEPVSE